MMPWWKVSNHQVFGGCTYMGTKRLLALPLRYGDPFYQGRGRGRGRGRGKREWLVERLSERERQTEGLEEALSMEMEEETEGDFVLRYLQKEIKERDQKKTGQYLQALGGEMEIFLFLPPLGRTCLIECHPLLPLLQIDFSQIGVALVQDFPLWGVHLEVFQ